MTASQQSAEDDSRVSLLPLATVIGYKQVILLLRYPVNTATLFVSMFLFFSLIFFGGRAVAGPAIVDSEAGIVVGFFLWTLATRSFRGLADSVMNEARWGTLERLFMSPYGFGTVMIVKTTVNIVLSLVWAGLMLLPMMAVTGRWLTIDLLTTVPLLLLTLLPIVGIGFAMGGLAVIFKRVENLFGILTFGFVGLIAAPVGEFPLLGLLPVTQGSFMTRQAMETGTRLWEFSAADLGMLVATGLVYTAVGFFLFQRAQRRARREGVLGHY